MKFTRSKCTVIDWSNQCIMEGTQSSDNCYLLLSPSTCCRLSVDDIQLWHQRLGHMNFLSLRRVVAMRVTRNVPELELESRRMSGPCHAGKRKKMSHKVFQHLVTTRVLELLQMDHMSFMLVKSIGNMKIKNKLDSKSDEAVFVGSLANSHAYRVFNKRTKTILEYINVVVGDVEKDVATRLDQYCLLEFEDVKQGDQLDDLADVSADTTTDDPDNILEDVSNSEKGKQRSREPSRRVSKNHPTLDVIRGRDERIWIRVKLKVNYMEMIECQEQAQFERNQVWNSFFEHMNMKSVFLNGYLNEKSEEGCLLIPQSDYMVCYSSC